MGAGAGWGCGRVSSNGAAEVVGVESTQSYGAAC